jgi:hypothetical protein
MLGKYWSVFLLAGLGVAALSDSRRGVYFRSLAPWLTIATGAVLIAPHVYWVATHDFEPIRYAFGAHPASRTMAAFYTLYFFGGILAYIGGPMLLNLVAIRPSIVAIGDSIWPPPGKRRTIIIALAAPIFLAAIGSILLKIRIGALWTMSGMTLLPVAMLSSPLVTVPRQAATRVLALAILYPIVITAAAPGIALVTHRTGIPYYGGHYQLVARAVESAWNKRTDRPLRVIGSYGPIVNGIEFYFENPPSTLDIITPEETPWVDDDRIKREGAIIVCPVPEAKCINALNAYVARFPNAQTQDVSLARRFFGALDEPVHYQIVTIPPE